MAEPSATHMTQAGPAPLPGAKDKKGARTPFSATVEESKVDISKNLSADPQLSGEFSGDQARSLAAEVDRIRKIRKPFGAMGQKLAIPDRWGYKRHWFNDSPGRIASAQAAGWSQIKDPTKQGEPLCIVVGSARNGQPQLAYAMEIPLEIWEEDMAQRNRVAADALAAVKAKPFRAKPGASKAEDRGKFYNPVEDEGRDAVTVEKG